MKDPQVAPSSAAPSAGPSAGPGYDPERLIRDHQRGVWRYLRGLGCPPAEADDLTQETFLAVLQADFQDHQPAATAAYLRTTARNLFLSARRRQGRVVAVADVELLDQQWDQWAAADQGERLMDDLRQCFQQLTARAQQALTWRFRDRLSREQIAAKLAIGQHGAKNLMQRAKQQLKECVARRMTAGQ